MARPQLSITAKQHVHYSRNVLGLNFGTIDNMLQNAEFSDGKNFDLAPQCALRKRDGVEAVSIAKVAVEGSLSVGNVRAYTVYTCADGVPKTATRHVAILVWDRPDGSRKILLMNDRYILCEWGVWINTGSGVYAKTAVYASAYSHNFDWVNPEFYYYTRPVAVPCGAGLFLTTGLGHLLMYDGEYVRPVGIDYTKPWENRTWGLGTDILMFGGVHAFCEGAKTPTVARATKFLGYIEIEPGTMWGSVAPATAGRGPAWNSTTGRFELIVPKTSCWLIDSSTGAETNGALPLNSAIWFCGLPLFIETATEVGDNYEYELGLSDLFDFDYFSQDYTYWNTQFYNFTTAANCGTKFWCAYKVLTANAEDLESATEFASNAMFDFNSTQDTGYDVYDLDGYHNGNLNGAYQYVLTQTTSSGYETNACSPSTAVSPANQQVRLLLNGFDDDSGYYGYDSETKMVNIYRTYADSPGHYYYLDSIPNPKQETGHWIGPYSYYDNKKDEELGEALHPYKLVPDYADAACTTKSTLIVARKGGVYVSEPGDPETFYTYLSFEDSVVGLAALPFFDEFVVFLKSKIYAVNIFDYSQRLLSNGLGLVGRHAVCVVDDRIVFQATGGGIYQIVGSGVSPVPGWDRVEPLLYNRNPKRSMSSSEYGRTLIRYLPKRKQVWFVLGKDGSHGNVVLVMDMNGAFTIYEFSFSVRDLVAFANGADEAVLILGTDSVIYCFNPGAQNDAGTAISFMAETGEIGYLDEQVRVRRVYADVIANTTTTVAVYGKYDGDAGWVDEGDLVIPAREAGFERGLNTFSKVVRGYQFKMEEAGSRGFTMKSFSLILQPKQERLRWHRD